MPIISAYNDTEQYCHFKKLLIAALFTLRTENMMRKTALMIMVLTIIAKILGFGRELVLSFFYGASTISDAYLISTTIPSITFSFLAAAFTAGVLSGMSLSIRE